MVVTLLAVVRAVDISPGLMSAAMVLAKHFRCCFNSLDSFLNTLWFRMTIDNDIGACEQISLIPLSTLTGFPLQATGVTELCSTPATVTC